MAAEQLWRGRPNKDASRSTRCCRVQRCNTRVYLFAPTRLFPPSWGETQRPSRVRRPAGDGHDVAQRRHPGSGVASVGRKRAEAGRERALPRDRQQLPPNGARRLPSRPPSAPQPRGRRQRGGTAPRGVGAGPSHRTGLTSAASTAPAVARRTTAGLRKPAPSAGGPARQRWGKQSGGHRVGQRHPRSGMPKAPTGAAGAVGSTAAATLPPGPA